MKSKRPKSGKKDQSTIKKKEADLLISNTKIQMTLAKLKQMEMAREHKIGSKKKIRLRGKSLCLFSPENFLRVFCTRTMES